MKTHGRVVNATPTGPNPWTAFRTPPGWPTQRALSATDSIDWLGPIPGLTGAQSRGVRIAAMLGIDAEILGTLIDPPIDAALALRRAKDEIAGMKRWTDDILSINDELTRRAAR